MRNDGAETMMKPAKLSHGGLRIDKCSSQMKSSGAVGKKCSSKTRQSDLAVRDCTGLMETWQHGN
jgi:hypothetical protein